MNTPELKWSETGTPGELETLLLNIGGQIGQPCSGCTSLMDGSEDDWGMILTANMIGTVVFESEFFCPKCLDAHLINRNRINECRLDGARNPSACASKKAKREGEGDHK